MKTDLKKRYYFMLKMLLLLIVISVIPVVVGIGIACTPGNGSADGWLGFWGSYLGTIPSGVIAYFVAKVQVDAEKSNYRENHLKDMLIINYREMYTKITIFEKAANIFINSKMGNINTIKLQGKVREVRENMTAIYDVNNIINILPKFDKEAELINRFEAIKDSSKEMGKINNEQIERIHDKKYDDDEEPLEREIRRKCINFDKKYDEFKKSLEKGIEEFSK